MKVIVIAGQQGSGKSTLADGLIKHFNTRYHNNYANKIKFADPLYKCHNAVSEILKQYDIPMEEKEGLFLQMLGDWGKKVKGDDVWINVALNRVEAHSHVGTEILIIEDCRYKTELDQFPNALKIRLKAPEDVRKNRAESWRGNSHSSENGLDNCDERFDVIIDTSLSNISSTIDVVKCALEKKFDL
jgi:uridine kinase